AAQHGASLSESPRSLGRSSQTLPAAQVSGSITRSLSREPLQHRNRRGKQRRNVGGQRLPDERLPLAPMWLAGPRGYLTKIEPHVCMRIVVFERMPAVARVDVDAQFLVQFARERRLDRLAGLELAARKLPVTFIRLAGR